MEAYLSVCLDTLLPFPDCEVIVVNDGSRDCTGEIAREYARRYPDTVRVIEKANGHYGSCVNAALKVATGEYVKVVDADDTCDRQVLADFLEWLRSLSVRPDMVINAYHKIDATGQVREAVSFPLPTDRCFTPDEAMDYGNVFVQLHAVTHRRENLVRMNYRQLEGVAYTDFQWALTPIAAVEKIAYFPRPLVRYLVGRAGQSVDPKILVRDVGLQAQVSLAIYREYRAARERGLSGCAKYYAEHILRNYAWMVQLYALGIGGVLPEDSGEAFDREAKTIIPEIHAQADGYAIGGCIRFHFIRAWRRHYSRNGLFFRLYRLFRRLFRGAGV